jgi:hypothetical protein
MISIGVWERPGYTRKGFIAFNGKLQYDLIGNFPFLANFTIFLISVVENILSLALSVSQAYDRANLSIVRS